MANPYFSFFNSTEFATYHNLNDELIEMVGIPVIYIPRHEKNPDNIFGEDPLNYYSEKYEMTMYLKSNLNWGGAGDLFSKFGLQEQYEVEFQIQLDRFKIYCEL